MIIAYDDSEFQAELCGSWITDHSSITQVIDLGPAADRERIQ
ncbi:MAG: hypothetical protein ACLQLC_06555 [Candidatus Sulfotelmatobacter sp.]